MQHQAIEAYLATLDSESSRIKMGQILSKYPELNLSYAEFLQIRSRLVQSGLAPNTINLHLAALRGVQKARWLLGEIDADTYLRMKEVSNVKGTRLPPGRHLPEADLTDLREAAAHPRDKALIAILHAGGLRREEVCTLNLDDIRHHSYGPVLQVLGKGNKQREIPIAGAMQALNEWLLLRGDEPGPLLCGLDRGGHPTGERLSPSTIWDILKRLSARAEVAHLSPHDFRRTLAGDLMDCADIVTVRDILGHRSVETTAQYDRRPKERMAAALSLARPA